MSTVPVKEQGGEVADFFLKGLKGKGIHRKNFEGWKVTRLGEGGEWWRYCRVGASGGKGGKFCGPPPAYTLPPLTHMVLESIPLICEIESPAEAQAFCTSPAVIETPRQLFNFPNLM
jgi:hypothetical protein